jgi:hypothetical protein
MGPRCRPFAEACDFCANGGAANTGRESSYTARKSRLKGACMHDCRPTLEDEWTAS